MHAQRVDARWMESRLEEAIDVACYRAFGDRFPYALVLLDPTLEITWSSPAFASLLGRSDDEATGLQVLDLVHPDDLAHIIPMALAVVENAAETLETPSAAGAVELPVRVLGGSGRWLPMMIVGRVFDASGRLLAFMRPAADRYALDVVLERLGERADLTDVVDALVDLVAAQFNIERAWLVHDTGDDLVIAGATNRPPVPNVAELLPTLRSGPQPSDIAHDDVRWIVPVTSSAGTIAAAFVLPSPRVGGPNPYDRHVLARTVSLASLAFARAEDDRRLQSAATTDHLTGVLNRGAFEQRLAQSALHNDHSPVAAFFIDLDGFKSINDTYGHHIGDEVLTVIAHRLLGAIRPGDSIGRLGGDEFAVLCPDIDSGELDTMAARLDRTFDDPVEVGGLCLGVTSAIGVASTHDSGGLEHLLRMADADMYRHKHQHRGRRAD